MLIYDTLSGKKIKLNKNKGDKIKMFVCGPTVYNHAHLGHARTYIVFDVVARWLRHCLVDLFYLQNITDIDDKIPDKKTAQHFEKEYLKDMKLLNVKSVNRYARASAHLKEIISQVKQLLEKGYAYQTKSGIYFEVRKFPDYGRLSKQNLDKLRSGWRIEPDPEKKDPLDFAIWKFSKAADYWKFSSPWGVGRPGWHIEDTAISEKYLGAQYDLHGAAVDLKFPHHESEIAQEESLSGKKPMVKIWLHAGFLMVNDEKMAKSLGNFITIKDFLKKYPAAVLRILVLSHHYRSPINYSEKIIHQYQAVLSNIDRFMRSLSQRPDKNLIKREKETEKEFNKAMDDDFNTPRALAALFKFAAVASKNDEAKKFLAEKFSLLGIIIKPPKISAQINRLLKKREELRRLKKFAEADKIRETVKDLGFLIED